MTPLSTALAVLGLLAAASPASASAATAHHSTQVLVRFKDGVPTAVRTALIQEAGGDLNHALPLDHVSLLDMTGDRFAGIDWLEDRPEVEWAEPNLPVQASIDSSYLGQDPYWPQLWSLENFGNNGGVVDADIDAAESWSITKGAGVTVGVVDTGVDASHPDLAGQTVPGVNFVPDGRTSDGSGHGTHVAGIIAALENTIGGVGAAPASKVQALRALDDSGAGTSATIASAFAHAGEEGLRIVNASLGSSGPSKAVLESISSNPDTLYVVAAGNAGVDIDSGGGATYPCQYDLANVLCVGASDNRDAPAAFSNRGRTSVDLSAPGVGIVSTAPGGGYQYESGTSMATPYAAAVAAQVASLHPMWTTAAIKEELTDTSDQPAALRGASMTSGRINAARAVGLYAGPDGQAPTPVTALKATAGVGRIDLAWDPATSHDLARYQVEWVQNGTWTYFATVEGTSSAATGLMPGVAQTFRVRAIDRSGEEGGASGTVVSTPLATAAEPPTTTLAPEAAKVKPAKAPKAAEGTPDAAIVSAVKRSKSKGTIRGLTFRLSAASKVTVTAVPSGGKVQTASAVTKTFALKAGARTVRFGRGAGALKLSKGTWRVTLATTSNKVSLKVSVR